MALEPPDNPGGGGSGGTQVIFQSTVTITAAALSTLHSAPVATNIPQPGAGKIVSPLGGLLQLHGGSATFPSISAYLARTGDTGGIINFGGLSPSNLSQVVSGSSGGETTPGFDATNKSLVLIAFSDAGITGAIATIAVTPGQGGTGYNVGDTFGITTFSGDAIGTVLTETGGVVETVTVTGAGDNAGTSYQTSTGNATSVLTGGGDGALQVDITVTAPATGDAQLDIWYGIVNALGS